MRHCVARARDEIGAAHPTGTQLRVSTGVTDGAARTQFSAGFYVVGDGAQHGANLLGVAAVRVLAPPVGV